MKQHLLAIVLIIFDALFLIAAFYLIVFEEILIKDFFTIIIIILFKMYYEKIYKLRYDFWQETKIISRSIFFSYLVVLALFNLLPMTIDYSNQIITLYFIAILIIIPVYKRTIKFFLFKFKIFKKNVLIIGNKKQVEVFKKEFDRNWYLGTIYTEEIYDAVIIASKNIHIDKLNKLIATYINIKKELYVVPYIRDLNFSNSNILEYTNLRQNIIQVENKLLNIKNILIKKTFDLFSLIIAMPLFIIIHIFIIILIKKDSKGDVLFKQKRMGKNNKTFFCYKYRTMYMNSEELLKEYLQKNPEEIKYYSKYHKYKNDPRITNIGRFLRQTSLDELPQFLNILRGEMSLVGPRPYMLNEEKKLGEYKNSILRVLPGITGLWQISGRNKLSFKKRNKLDIWYIKNWSAWFDFVILIKTFKVVFLRIGSK